MARLRLLGLAIGFASVFGLTAGPASAGGDRHPLFNDAGTLAWYTNLDEAQAVARATGKLIFIESGRRMCGNCRHVVEEVLPASNVRSRIAAIAIGLADDCDESDPRVSAMLNSGIPAATVLPLCGFVTPELRWVTGFSGYMDPGSFSGHLSRAEDRFEQVKSYRRRSTSPPAVCTPPAPVAVAPPPAPRPAPPPAPRPAPVPPAPAAPAPIIKPPYTPAPSILPGESDDCPGGVCHLPPRPARPAPTPVQPARPIPPPVAVVPPSKSTPTPPAAALLPAPAVISGSTPPVIATVTPLPKAAAVAVAATPMDRARHAAAEGRWGDVLKVNDESPRLPVADRAELDALVRRANDWVLGSFESVVAAAKAHRYPDAKRTLSVLTRQLDGTTCPGLIDAERGTRAVDRLSAMEQGAPEQADAPEVIRKSAYAEFRGTRWAPLFRGRTTGR